MVVVNPGLQAQYKGHRAKDNINFPSIFEEKYGLKAYIKCSPLEISLKELSNSVWKSLNDIVDQKLWNTKVRMLKSWAG